MTTYYNNYPTELQEELRRIANAIVAPGKGILAADESTATCGKRFAVSSYHFITKICLLRNFCFFRISESRTTKRIVAHTVNCFSPPTMLSLPTFPVSSCTTKLSTRRLLMDPHSLMSSRRRESFPESRSTVESSI